MKFEDAYLGMKVISDGPLKIRGVINAIDDKEKSVRVKGERLNLWFFQNKHTEYDIAYLKKDAKADANIIDCAKKISKCCQYYRDNPETDYCHGCPFYQNDYRYSYKGCILRDCWGNEIDNPGDWCLD